MTDFRESLPTPIDPVFKGIIELRALLLEVKRKTAELVNMGAQVSLKIEVENVEIEGEALISNGKELVKTNKFKLPYITANAVKHY